MADPGDVQTLAAKLRGKGLSDAEVTEGLRGMGFSATEARDAVGTPAPSPGADSPAPAQPARGSSRGAAGRPGRSGGTGGRSGGSRGGGGGAFGALSMPSAPSMPSMTLTPPKSANSKDLGGFIAGVFFYALALSYIRYGSAGPKAWLSAKFLNVPMTIPGPGKASAGADTTDSDLTNTRATRPASV